MLQFSPQDQEAYNFLAKRIRRYEIVSSGPLILGISVIHSSADGIGYVLAFSMLLSVISLFLLFLIDEIVFNKFLEDGSGQPLTYANPTSNKTLNMMLTSNIAMWSSYLFAAVFVASRI